MAKAKVKLLEGGRRQILSAAAGFASFAPHSFKVGDLAGFIDASATETLPRGDIVFTGDAYLMQARLQDEGAVKYTMMLPEGAGPFNVGNIVMYTVAVGQQPVPYAMIILPFRINKKLSEYDIGPNGMPNPGNRMMISLTVKHRVHDVDDVDNIIVEVIAPEYANLPYFDRETNLPSPSLNPWSQFIVQRAALTGQPALATKGDDERYWIMPFFKDIRHPKYNVMSGGISGDGYKETEYGWLWSHRYTTPEGQYKGSIGGYSYTSIGVAALNRVGGVPYTESE